MRLPPCPAGPLDPGFVTLVLTRRQGGSELTVPIPKPFVAELRQHKEDQEATSRRVGDLWVDRDLVLVTGWGPISSESDYQEWIEILVG